MNIFKGATVAPLTMKLVFGGTTMVSPNNFKCALCTLEELQSSIMYDNRMVRSAV